ncbi:hypothetical protein ACFQJC_10560 [Haloferax namakaokahaiae]|uniref:Uncharacterized protein n=1 Tax=Haloferax namakaokahaiae TaxID=1748331 RepID=A0ABD5ZFI7_9EURY
MADADGTDESGTDVGGPVPIGVKLGSTRTVLAYPDGDGGIETVRTLTCLAAYEDPVTGDERVCYGEKAARQYPDRVEFPLRSGLPEDERRAELAGQFFEELCENHELPDESGVVYAIPTIDDEPGLVNLNEVIEESTIGQTFVRSFPESLCGAFPAMGDGMEAIDGIFVAVNLGATSLEACAYRHGEQLAPFVSESATGNDVDRRIASAVEEETRGRVNIDTTTAREYKEVHGDFGDFEPFTDVVQQPGGGSHEFTIERSVMDPLDEYLDSVVAELANDFLSQLANAYMKPYQLALARPVVVTGGMACLPGIIDEFEARLSDELGRDITAVTADRPDLAAAEGAYRIARRLAESST